MNAGDDHPSAQHAVETQWAYEDSMRERGIENEREFIEQTAELRRQHSQRAPVFRIPEAPGVRLLSSPAVPDPAEEIAAAEQRATGVAAAAVSPAAPPTVTVMFAESDSSTPSGHTNSAAISSDDATCVVCLSMPRELTILRCGHQCVCCDCYPRLLRSDKRCPICRRRIQGIYRNF